MSDEVNHIGFVSVELVAVDKENAPSHSDSTTLRATNPSHDSTFGDEIPVIRSVPQSRQVQSTSTVKNNHIITTTDFLNVQDVTLSWDFQQLYITDSLAHCIRIVDLQRHKVSLFAGIDKTEGFQDGPRLTALFNHPSGICLTSKNEIFLCDRWNHRIRFIDLSGFVWTVPLSKNSLSSNNIKYYNFNCTLRTSSSSLTSSSPSLGSSQKSGFSRSFSNATTTVTPNSTSQTDNITSISPCSPVPLGPPSGITPNTSSSNILSESPPKADAFSPVFFLSEDSTPNPNPFDSCEVVTKLRSPVQLCLDEKNQVIFVADEHSIVQIGYGPHNTGEAYRIAGQCGMKGYSEGLPSETLFRLPRSLVLRESQEGLSELLVVDFCNDRIRKIPLNLTTPVTSILGNGNKTTCFGNLSDPRVSVCYPYAMKPVWDGRLIISFVDESSVHGIGIIDEAANTFKLIHMFSASDGGVRGIALAPNGEIYVTLYSFIDLKSKNQVVRIRVPELINLAEKHQFGHFGLTRHLAAQDMKLNIYLREDFVDSFEGGGEHSSMTDKNSISLMNVDAPMSSFKLHKAVLFSRCPDLIPVLQPSTSDQFECLPKYNMTVHSKAQYEMFDIFLDYVYTDNLPTKIQNKEHIHALEKLVETWLPSSLMRLKQLISSSHTAIPPTINDHLSTLLKCNSTNDNTYSDLTVYVAYRSEMHEPLFEGAKTIPTDQIARTELENPNEISCYVEFKLHKIVICSRSAFWNSLCFGYFKESKADFIVLDEDPTIFKLAIEILYQFYLPDLESQIYYDLYELSMKHQFENLISKLEHTLLANVSSPHQLKRVQSLAQRLSSWKLLKVSHRLTLSGSSSSILADDGISTCSSAYASPYPSNPASPVPWSHSNQSIGEYDSANVYPYQVTGTINLTRAPTPDEGYNMFGSALVLVAGAALAATAHFASFLS